MYTNQQGHEQSHTNADETNNSDCLIDREKVEGTPFWLEKVGDEGYYLRMGRHRLTIETFETKGEGLEYINYNMYDLILKMIIAVTADRDEWAIQEAIKATKMETI